MRKRKGCELLKRNSSAVRERERERERLDALFAEMQSKGEKNTRGSRKYPKKRSLWSGRRLYWPWSSLILTARDRRRGAGIASYSRGIQFRPWNSVFPRGSTGSFPCGRFRGRRFATALSDNIDDCTGVASILSSFFSQFNIPKVKCRRVFQPQKLVMSFPTRSHDNGLDRYIM